MLSQRFCEVHHPLLPFSRKLQARENGVRSKSITRTPRNPSTPLLRYLRPTTGDSARMTLPQILSFAVLGGMMLLFVWGRIRYDLVAVLALLVALLVGIVKPKQAFSGFSDDIV